MNDRVAIITGAASGVGRHFATELQRRRPQMRLVLTDVNEPALIEAFEPGERVVLRGLDIRSAEAWAALADETTGHFGQIDYLCNIAGIDRAAMFIDQPLEAIDSLVDVNLKGTLYGMRVVGRQMAERGSGHIINVASLAGVAPTPGTAIYSATKFGVRGASIAIAVELRRHGVYVTVICPDLIDTPMMDQHLDDERSEDVALIFSGSRALRTDEVSEAIFHAMRDRPLEIDLPFSRGLLSKLSSFAPTLLMRLHGLMTRRGHKQVERARLQRDHMQK